MQDVSGKQFHFSTQNKYGFRVSLGSDDDGAHRGHHRPAGLCCGVPTYLTYSVQKDTAVVARWASVRFPVFETATSQSRYPRHDDGKEDLLTMRCDGVECSSICTRGCSILHFKIMIVDFENTINCIVAKKSESWVG